MATLPPTALLACWGDRAPTWLPACLESLVDPGGVTAMVLALDTAAYRETTKWFDWASARKVSLAMVRIDANGEAARFRALAEGDPAVRPLAKLVAWRMALRCVPHGARFVALDADVLVRRPLAEVFTTASPTYSTLAAPRTLQATGKYRTATCCVAGTAAPMTERLLDDWVRALLALGAGRARAAELYGSPESAAWASVAQQVEELGGAVVGRLADAWAWEPHRATGLWADAGLAHFAGRLPSDAWPPALLEAWLGAKHRSGL